MDCDPRTTTTHETTNSQDVRVVLHMWHQQYRWTWSCGSRVGRFRPVPSDEMMSRRAQRAGLRQQQTKRRLGAAPAVSCSDKTSGAWLRRWAVVIRRLSTLRHAQAMRVSGRNRA